MSDLTWGDALWDQYEKIQEHTEIGLEFTKKCSDYIKDRMKAELDYAKSLRSLKKKYRLKNAAETDDFASYTTIGAYNVSLEQLELVAREHEILAERLNDEVYNRMRTLHKETTNNRKNLCNQAAHMQQQYQGEQDLLEKSRQKYEKMAKDADGASQAFGRVNDDMNATKAQVEKSRNQMNHRQDLMEKAKGDYIIQIEKTNNYQHDYYNETWPSLLNQIQKVEESRIFQMGEMLHSHCTLHINILPQIKSCLDTCAESCELVNPSQDSDLLMEERTKQPHPPDHTFLEYGSRPNNTNLSSAPSIRKNKKDRKKTKIFGRPIGGSSESVNKENYDNLPPEKRKKAFKEKIKDIDGKIQIELKARQGLEDILELYSQKPELGSTGAIEESRQQLDTITLTLDKFQDELYKYQCYLAAMDDKPVPDKPHLGSHLQPDSVSMTSSITSHASHSNVDIPVDQYPIHDEFIPVSPPADFTSNHTDSYYEVPDPSIPPLAGPVSGGLTECSVLYDYIAQHEDELNIYAGERLYILEDNGTGWVKAQRNESEMGLIPGNYIEI